MYINKNKAIRRLPCCWNRCPHRLFLQTLELFYSIGTFCISLEFYTMSEYLNNVFRTLGSTKHLNDICLTYTLRSKNVKFNQTFIQPNPNVPETFFVSWGTIIFSIICLWRFYPDEEGQLNPQFAVGSGRIYLQERGKSNQRH